MALLRRTIAVILGLVALGHTAARLGDAAPDFTLPDRAGRPVTLADLRGKVVLVDFWASWCAPCRTALPALDAMQGRHAAEGLVVLGLDIDMEPAQAERFLAERLPRPALRILRDQEAVVMGRYGASGMPALYLVDRAGIVRLVEAGYDPEKLPAVEQVVDELLGPGGRSP